VTASASPLQIYIQIGKYIWILGIAAMLLYSIISILLLKHRLKGARNIEGRIYEVDNLKTPFALGVFKPRIYVPAGLDMNENSYIIRHEQTHIRRFDHIIKPFSFLVLSIHWFNPLVWIAFVLMGADMELSCDERVIKEMGSEIKRAYSVSLLSFATGKRIINGSPLAFGEGSVGGRIKNVLNYKRPAFWVTAAAIIIAAAVGIGLLANPRQSVSLTKSSAFPGDPRLDEAISVVINGPMENKTASASITEKYGNFGWGQLADFLAMVKVYRKEVSLNRSEDRDKTYQIIFSKSANSALAINFSKDFSEVWINNGVKPGYSYKVVHPSYLRLP
jgi:hypothetical protein